MSKFKKLVWWVGLSSCIAVCVGCGGKDDEEVIECCMLRKSADECTSSNNSSSLNEAIREWREVGTSGDNEACELYVSDRILGCSGPTLDYDESDALADCAD